MRTKKCRKTVSYNFDEIVPRRGTNSYKWDSDCARDCQPLWVADMDFRAAPAILDALRRRVEHGVFGYTHVPDAYYEAIDGWFTRRYGWHVAPESVIYTSGVVPAVSAVLRAMTRPGDKVVLHTPAYNCFFSSIRNMECQLVPSPLLEIDHHYAFDWAQMETVLPEAKVLILCNPHNPSGRMWTREELARLSELCHKHGVFVLSDEIHGELSLTGERYVPYATVSVDDNYCVCTSCTKAFNIAGLQIANIIVPNADLRQRIDRAINIHENCDVNPFGVDALIAAYNESESWLDELCLYLRGNYRVLQEALPNLTRMEATYLAWLPVENPDAVCERLAREQHLLLNSGTMYGDDRHVRINFACPREALLDAVGKLVVSM